MLWLFGEGILSDHEMFHKEIYILRGFLKLVTGAVSQWLNLLIVFEGIYEPCYWISAILLMGPRRTPGDTT